MSQTSYSIDIPAVSYPGQVVDASLVKDALSVVLQAAAVPFGVFVCRDGANMGDFTKIAARVPAAASDITTVGNLIGVLLAEQVIAQDPSVSVPTWPRYSVAAALRKGRVWVLSETAVVDGAAVFVRHAVSGSNTQLGRVRADADSGTAAAAPQCVFRGTYSAPGYVVVELDLV